MTGLPQQLGGLAPEAALHEGLTGDVLQEGIARVLALGLFQPGQPDRVQRCQPRLQHRHQLALLRRVEFGPAGPQRLQPGPHARGGVPLFIGIAPAHQGVGARGGRQRQFGHGPLTGIQPLPDGFELGHVVGFAHRVQRQAAQDAARGFG